jgi:hypothetical protein
LVVLEVEERDVGDACARSATVQNRLQPVFKAKFAMVLADRVDDREVALAGSAA